MEIIMNLCARRKIVHEGYEKMHDAPMVGHHGEKTTRELLGKKNY